MTWIVESPFWLLLLLILVSVGCAIFAFSGAGKIFHFISAGFFIAAIGVFIVAQAVVTDREQIRTNIIDLANAVASNDVEKAVSFFHPQAEDSINEARNEMPGYEFTTCNVTSVKEIVFDDSNNPSTATVEIRVFVNVNAPRYGYNGLARRAVVLKFQKTTGGEWKIADYNHFDPQQRDYAESRNPDNY